MSADRLTLCQFVAQRTGSLSEHHIWCLLSEAAHSLSNLLETDPGAWVSGPSLLISPDTILIGPDRVEYCLGAYNSEIEEHSLFMPPEMSAHKGGEGERGDVERMYVFSLGMCVMASAMSLQEESDQEAELKLGDKNLNDLLTRMAEEDPARRDVTLQLVLDACAAYQETCGEDLKLAALPGVIGGSARSSLSVDEEIGEFDVSDGNPDNHIPLSRELDEAYSPPPPLPSSPPPRPTSAAIQRVNSLDNLYRHITDIGATSQDQKRSRFSGMYSRHISASLDDVTLTSSEPSIPPVPLDTDTSLLLGVHRSIERPLSTDSTGIPRNVTPAKVYSGDSSSSEEESGSSTLSEADSGEDQLPDSPDTFIKLSGEELQKLDALLTRESIHTDSPDLSPTVTRPPDTQRSPPLTPTNRSPPSPHTPLLESYPAPATQEDVIISLVDTQQSDIAGAEPDTAVQEPSPTPPLPSSRPADSSPVMRGEENKGRLRKSETDLLTLSQALEAGPPLPTDTHSGTESGDELTPSLARKKQGGSRRRISDHEVFVFEPTYDDEWQHLESREESMKKLGQLLGPDFRRLAASTPPDAVTDPLSPLKTPAHRREVEVILLNTRKFVATVEETSLVRDLFLQVVSFLSLQEPSNFSLAVIQRREEVFLDLDLPLLKYAPRGWMDRQTDAPLHSLAKRRGRSRRFSVYFRVKFFVENVRILRSRQTRHLYYLQLRKDLLDGRVSCDEEPALSLAGLSLQIEMGDFRSEFEGVAYYKLGDYLAERVVELIPADTISDTLKQLHKSYQGLSRTEAELAYLKQAQKLPEYGIVYHRVTWQKRGQNEEVWAGVSTRGFMLSEIRDTVKVPVLSFSWKLIKLMWYRNKRFVIEPQEVLPHAEIILQTDNFKQSMYLLKLSQQFHKFQMITRGLGSEEQGTHYLGDGVSFYGSLSTLHSGKSDPYVPLMDAEVDALPLPSGLDIPVEPGLKLMSVSLKHAPSLGFGLTVILNPPDKVPGLYIQHIAENGPAHLDGRLKLYDQIMSVNGKPITGSTYKDVLSLLQTSREIEIIVKTECEVVDSVFTMETTPIVTSKMFGKIERGFEEFEITLKRGVSQDFGFTVEDVQEENGEMSVVIREITNRDVAGMLLPGDRILEINSVRLITLKSTEINIFLETFTDIHILIQRDAPTEEKRLSQIEESGYVRMTPSNSPKKMMLPPTPPTLPAGDNTAKKKNSPYSVVKLDKTRKPSPKTEHPSPPPVPPVTLEKFMEPNYLEFDTELAKTNGSLGLSINILTRQPGIPVYVTELVEGSPAAHSGEILPGDQIVSISDQSLTEMGVAEQVKFLGDLPDGETLLFKIRREYIPEESPDVEVFEKLEEKVLESSPPSALEAAATVSVMLTKHSSGGLGIRLHTVNEADGTVGIYIKEILRGSSASQAAELHPGARIVSINHQSLTGVSRSRAVSMLKKAASPVIIEIIPDPLMVASELSITASPPPPDSEGNTPLKRVDTDTTLSKESLSGRSPSTLELMVVLDSPNVREEYFSVPLTRGDKGLGLKVVSKLPEQTGLMIKSVLGDPAMSSGKFEIGDEIVAIDGANIQSMKRVEVLARIKGEAGTSVQLDIKRYIRIESSIDIQESDRGREEGTRPEDYPASLLILNQVSTNSYSRPLPEHKLIEHVFELKLSRGSDEKLGIHLGLLPPENFPSGINVKKLTENSVASSDGRLSVDDILLEANGVDLRNFSKDEAVETLKQLTGEIQFLVARYAPYNFPLEVLDEFEVEVPPLPESAPPPMPPLSQAPDLSIVLEQTSATTVNTDTIVLESTSTQPEHFLHSMDSSESVPPYPSPLIPSTPPPPPPDSELSSYLQHSGVQQSTVRLVEPYTQLSFDTYAQEDAHKEIQMINTEMEPLSVENDFKEVRLRKPELSITVAKLPHNVKKSRSLRTLPYDSNRVVLNSTEPEEDFINASIVQLKVNELEFKYICTQAPPPPEIGRFWQMVWEQELYVIVMLVEQKEYGSRRTYPYWSQAENAELKDEEKMDFGQFSVMLMAESERENMVTRMVHVCNKTSGESRHILHLTYKSWSGTGIPKSMGQFRLFVEFIRERVRATEVLVHCHIGIGRTGTFCLVDILSRLIKNRVRADLFQLVVALNANRMNMIQTTEQYKFGYTALLHLLYEKNP